MSTYSAGKVSVTPRGQYSASTQYERLDVVTDNGNSYMYIHKTPATGVSLSTTTHWMEIAQKGETGAQGPQGSKGDKGAKGDKGDTIVSIIRTAGNGAEGTVDTYTITMSSGDTSTFQVRNGSKGSTGDTGPKGDKGEQGVSITNIVRTSGTGAEGTTDVYTITLSNGVQSTFNVRNGSKGNQGIQGPIGNTGLTGPKGDPGVSITNGVVNVKEYGATGDGVTDDTAAIQAAVNSGAKIIVVPNGEYSLGGGTITMPLGVQVFLAGGKLSNGTLACNETYFNGARGLASTITLSGTICSDNAVFFDWFDCEKSTAAQYNTFINGDNATYGAVPTISATNRTILDRLIKSNYPVQFGIGIYPFDAEINLGAHTFYISGTDRNSTILWAPSSSFLNYTSGGASYPYIKDIRIEAYNSVLKTKANTVNAIHGLMLRNSFFTSYTDHTFWNDYSIAGGTGCPIYGSKILDTHVYAGADKGCFYGWGSGSNVFDNVCDLPLFFNGIPTNKKGIANALFWNSNVRSYCNSNISYSGLNYVARFDRPSALNHFYAYNNVFEENTYSFQAIVKTDSGSSNLYLGLGQNMYIGNVSKENGYACILLSGNTYIKSNLDNVILYGNTVRNLSAEYVRVVTTKTDAGNTKYRLAYFEPYTTEENVNALSSLMTPSADLATLMGMRQIYDADSANISYFQITSSRRSVNGSTLGVRASGTTAARPTTLIAPNYMYFDTTLGKPIWWNGSVWKDATGVTV